MNIIKKYLRILFKPNVNAVYMCKLALLFSNKGHRFLSILIKNRLIYKYGIHLGLGSQIGENLRLPHPQNIIIGEGAVIGDNCEIYHNVTLGTKHSVKTKKVEYPRVGNNVKIYTGSIIIGGITIGDNSIIGAGSLVMKDVEPNSVYTGNPAKKMGGI